MSEHISNLVGADLDRIDVVCIANYTNLNVLRSIHRLQGSPMGSLFFKPLRFNLKGVNGAIIVINSETDDLMTPSGIKRARKQFMPALAYAADLGAKVVVLGASLKRLFGEFFDDKVDSEGGFMGKRLSLKEHYPEIVFTNGDNGTASILLQEINDIISRAGVSPGSGDKIAVLGAGLLGIESIKHLINIGYRDSEIIIVSSHSAEDKKVVGDRSIRIYDSLSNIEGNVDLLICCAHKNQVIAEQIDVCGIRFVLDVAAPAAFPQNEYLKSHSVYRQDGGNAYSTDLNYEFDPNVIDLVEHEIYGCFAEGTSIALSIKNKGAQYAKILKELNWFTVSEENKKMVSDFFSIANFSKHPTPLCFGRKE